MSVIGGRSESSRATQGPAPRLLNLRQAAVYLGVSFWSVRDYVLAGLLPHVQLPALRPREGDRARQTLRRVLVDREDLDAFIVRHKAGESESRARCDSRSDSKRSVPEIVPIEGAQKREGYR